MIETEKVLFTLGVTSPIDGVIVLNFEKEWDLLDAWWQFVLTTYPDVITGFNILGFDFPYLLQRALGLSDEFRY